MKDSLGATGKKDAMKRNDSSVKVEISLKEAAPKKLNEVTYRESKSRKRKWGIDR